MNRDMLSASVQVFAENLFNLKLWILSAAVLTAWASSLHAQDALKAPFATADNRTLQLDGDGSYVKLRGGGFRKSQPIRRIGFHHD